MEFFLILGLFFASFSTNLVALPVSVGNSKTLSKVNMIYGIAAQFKPIYYEDPGQEIAQSLQLSSEFPRYFSASLSASFSSIFRPVKATYMNGLSLAVKRSELIKKGNLEVAGSLIGSVPSTNPVESLPERYGDVAASMSTTLEFLNAIFSHEIGYKNFLFKETVNENGRANRDFELRNSLALSFDFSSLLRTELSTSLINRFYYQGSARDFYETGVDLGVKVNKATLAHAGVSTSTARVRDGTIDSPKLFTKDLTAAQVGIKVKF